MHLASGVFFDRSGVAMDTSVSLRATGEEAKEAVDEGFERLAVLDKLAGQNEDSDVSRINAAAGKDYVKVDPAIYEMIEYAKDYSAKSQGEWDITIGVMTTCGISAMPISMCRRRKKSPRP